MYPFVPLNLLFCCLAVLGSEAPLLEIENDEIEQFTALRNIQNRAKRAASRPHPILSPKPFKIPKLAKCNPSHESEIFTQPEFQCETFASLKMNQLKEYLITDEIVRITQGNGENEFMALKDGSRHNTETYFDIASAMIYFEEEVCAAPVHRFSRKNVSIKFQAKSTFEMKLAVNNLFYIFA